jgi:CheY-like chemotaxis protein
MKRILIVDDERSITHLLKLNLEKTGAYPVRTENQRSKAFDAAREFQPHLILLDVMMPDLDGGHVAAQLQNSFLKSIPVVFLTAAVRKQEVDARKGTIGGAPFIAKPVKDKSILAIIEEKLNKTKDESSYQKPKE